MDNSSVATEPAIPENGSTQIQLELNHDLSIVGGATENGSISIPYFHFYFNESGVVYFIVTNTHTDDVPAMILTQASSSCPNLTLSAGLTLSADEFRDGHNLSPCLGQKYAIIYCEDELSDSTDNDDSDSSLLKDGEKIGEDILPYLIEALAASW